MELKVRKDNRKENTCDIDKYEVYNTSFGFLGLSDPKGLASHSHKGSYTRRGV